LLASTPFDLKANAYHDPLGQLPYTPPFIAYTRLCAFLERSPLIEFLIPDSEKTLNITGVLINGHAVDTVTTPGILDSLVGVCLTVPPGINSSSIDVTFASNDNALSVIMKDLEYTTLLPKEIACTKFKCDKEIVVINGTMEGEILGASTIVIQNDVIIMGNLTVDGSITLDANSSLLTTQGSLSATNGIIVILNNNTTYHNGEEVSRVIAKDLRNTTVEFIGGRSHKSCQELQSKIIHTSKGFAFVVSLSEAQCQVNSASSQVNFSIIIPCIAAGVVVIATVIALIMYTFQQYKRGKFSSPRVIMTHE